MEATTETSQSSTGIPISTIIGLPNIKVTLAYDPKSNEPAPTISYADLKVTIEDVTEEEKQEETSEEQAPSLDSLGQMRCKR
jgi:hypothetical protein